MTVSRLIELLSDISVSDPRHPDEREVRFIGRGGFEESLNVTDVGIIKNENYGKEVVFLTVTGDWKGVYE